MDDMGQAAQTPERIVRPREKSAAQLLPVGRGGRHRRSDVGNSFDHSETLTFYAALGEEMGTRT